MLELLKSFYKDESGATMVEYAIMVALIAIAVAAVVILLSNEMNSMFNTVINCMAAPSSTSCSFQSQRILIDDGYRELNQHVACCETPTLLVAGVGVLFIMAV